MECDMQKLPHDWLKEKYGTSYQVPRKLSPEAIESLLKLKEINVESDRDADKIIMYLEKLTEEIKSEDMKIRSVLEKLGLSVSELDDKSKNELEYLIKYQMKYNLKDLGKTTISLDRAERRLKEVEEASLLARFKREQTILKFMMDRLQNATAELEIQSKKEEKYLRNLLKEGDKKMIESAEMSSEIEKSKTELHELQMQLYALNVTDNPVHRRVLDHVKEVNMLEKQITECQAQLKQYKGLPPNFFEARKKLSEIHDKLRDVESKVIDYTLGKK